MGNQGRSRRQADVAIIGGGLTGILATLRLAKAGASVVLIDAPLPQAKKQIGGFARFSGAKFSLPPAGMGLLPAAGSMERLTETIDQVLEVLGLTSHEVGTSADHFSTSTEGFALRRYDSIVLTPSEVESLLSRLSGQLTTGATVVQGRATELRSDGARWTVTFVRSASGGPSEEVVAQTVFYAAGRLSDDVLIRAGAIPTEGKGLDIGVRLEFMDKNAVSGLRRHGPDAKVMHDHCRTFCLNSPGTIYRYPFRGITVPGGVVAEESTPSANVGVLLRVPGKEARIQEIVERARPMAEELVRQSSILRSQASFSIPDAVSHLYGEEAAGKLEHFCRMLDHIALVDLRQPHRVHIPLLDWHWHTFAAAGSHRTTLENVYALGDSAGHARGLLQAGVSGWLAAEEFLC